MSLLFNRKIRLIFGKPGAVTRVEELYMQFDIEKTSESEPNKGSVNVHNLNATSRALLQQKDTQVLLEAGYGTDLGKLAVGTVNFSPTERSGNEAVTHIEFQDGGKQYKTAKVATTLAPGATTKQVLETLASSMGVGVGSVKGLVEDTFQQGVSLFGPTRDKLDEITGKMGVEWSIQDGNLQILPRKVPSQQLAVVISPSTGLIASPTEREDAKGGGKFIEFRSLLNVNLKPGVSIRIKSRDIDGYFKVRKAHFQGDNRGGEFSVRCEAVEIEPTTQANEQINTTGTVEEQIQ